MTTARLIAAIVFLGARLALADYQSVILADSPIGFWRTTETTGTTLFDTSGNGWNAGLSGGYTLGVAGPFGACSRAVQFDGINGMAVVGGSGGAPFHISTTGSLSVEVWALVTNPTPARFLPLVAKGYHNGPETWEWALQQTTSNSAIWQTYQLLGNDHGFAAGGGFSTSAFHHFVGTVTDLSQINMYVDGALVNASASFTGTITDGITEVTFAKYDGLHGATDASVYWPGVMSNVAIYPTLLSSVQALNHYNAGLAELYNCGARADWPMTSMLDRRALHWFLEDGRQAVPRGDAR